jgi:hypothetical protein
LGENLLADTEDVDVGAADKCKTSLVFVNVEVDEGVGNTREKLAALGIEECCLFVVERSALLTNTYQTRDDEEVRIDLVADGHREVHEAERFSHGGRRIDSEG